MFYPFSCYYKLNCFLDFIFSLFIVSASMQLILAYCILQPWLIFNMDTKTMQWGNSFFLMRPGQLDSHTHKLDPYLTK